MGRCPDVAASVTLGDGAWVFQHAGGVTALACQREVGLACAAPSIAPLSPAVGVPGQRCSGAPPICGARPGLRARRDLLTGSRVPRRGSFARAPARDRAAQTSGSAPNPAALLRPAAPRYLLVTPH